MTETKSPRTRKAPAAKGGADQAAKAVAERSAVRKAQAAKVPAAKAEPKPKAEPKAKAVKPQTVEVKGRTYTLDEDGSVLVVTDDAEQHAWSKSARHHLGREESAALRAWVKGGKVGDRPVTLNLDRIQAEYEGKISPARVRNGAKGKGKATSRVIPEGKTSAGLDRMDDAAIVKWAKAYVKSLPKGELPVKTAALKALRASGTGCNPQRFFRLFEQATA